MTFKTILLAAAFVLPAGLALAQGAAPAAPPPDLKSFATAADVQALLTKAKAMPAAPLILQPIIGTGPYRVSLEYRSGPPAPAALHEGDTELMLVMDGSGTVTTGGTLVNQTRPNPTNLSGTAITGGTPLHMVKGDMTIVAAGVPHQIAADAGGPIVLITFHVPGVWPGH